MLNKIVSSFQQRLIRFVPQVLFAEETGSTKELKSEGGILFVHPDEINSYAKKPDRSLQSDLKEVDQELFKDVHALSDRVLLDRTLIFGLPKTFVRKELDGYGLSEDKFALLLENDRSGLMPDEGLNKREIKKVYTLLSLISNGSLRLSKNTINLILDVVIRAEKSAETPISKREGELYLGNKVLRNLDDPYLIQKMQYLMTGTLVHVEDGVSTELLGEIRKTVGSKGLDRSNLAFLLYKMDGSKKEGPFHQIELRFSELEKYQLGIEFEYIPINLKKERSGDLGDHLELHPDQTQDSFEVANKRTSLGLNKHPELFIDLIRLQWSSNFGSWNSVHLHFDMQNLKNAAQKDLLGIEHNPEDGEKPDTWETKWNQTPVTQKRVGNEHIRNGGELDLFGTMLNSLIKSELFFFNEQSPLTEKAREDLGKVVPAQTFSDKTHWFELRLETVDYSCCESLAELELATLEAIIGHPQIRSLARDLYLDGSRTFLRFSLIREYRQHARDLILRMSSVEYEIEKYRIIDILATSMKAGGLNKDSWEKYVRPGLLSLGLANVPFGRNEDLIEPLIRKGWLTKEIWAAHFPTELLAKNIHHDTVGKDILVPGLASGLIDQVQWDQLLESQPISDLLSYKVFNNEVLTVAVVKGRINQNNWETKFTPEILRRALEHEPFAAVLVDQGFLNKGNIDRYFPASFIRESMYVVSLMGHVGNRMISRGFINETNWLSYFPLQGIASHMENNPGLQIGVVAKLIEDRIMDSAHFSKLFASLDLGKLYLEESFNEYVVKQAIESGYISAKQSGHFFSLPVIATNLESPGFIKHIISPLIANKLMESDIFPMVIRLLKAFSDLSSDELAKEYIAPAIGNGTLAIRVV
jgi:hypothetical protein